jgi:uncharacterized protein YhhL (DUF1145 family)
MSVLGFIVLLVLIGVGLYLLNTLVPMDSKIKTIINVVVVLLVVLWVLQVFGLFGSLGTIPRLRH